MSIYFTSDLHFGHDRDFIYIPRGYKNFYEHDEDVVRRWNQKINWNDDVYILGDLMLGDNTYGRKILNQLNGQLHIIYGNHDTDVRKDIYNNLRNVVEIMGYAGILKYKKWHFYLSHYVTMTKNYDDTKKHLAQNLINLCGHIHTPDKFCEMRNGIMSYHVELDAHSNEPISIEEIIEDIKNFYGIR